MNNLWKEIARQCWDIRMDNKLHFDQEMFAELIVKECMKKLQYMHGKVSDHHNYYLHASIELKDHFGMDDT